MTAAESLAAAELARDRDEWRRVAEQRGETLHAAEERSASWAHGYQRLHYGHQYLVRGVSDLRMWAVEQTGQCRMDEAKFGAATPAIDAARELMVLQEVVRQIDAALKGSRAEPRAAAPEALSLEDAAGITDVIRGAAAQGEEK